MSDRPDLIYHAIHQWRRLGEQIGHQEWARLSFPKRTAEKLCQAGRWPTRRQSALTRKLLLSQIRSGTAGISLEVEEISADGTMVNHGISKRSRPTKFSTPCSNAIFHGYGDSVAVKPAALASEIPTRKAWLESGSQKEANVE
ncbi:hypothetical protein X727_31860 [Mesorhizobium sp. L103C119B0]|nr:hypothetical protein X727_31860 [Mesorhizobium sp. L103C119B0]